MSAESEGNQKKQDSFADNYYYNFPCTDPLVFTLEPPIANPRATVEEIAMARRKLAEERAAAYGVDVVLMPKYLMIVKVIITTRFYPKRKINYEIIDQIQNKLFEMAKDSREEMAPFVRIHRLAEYTRNSVAADCIGINVEDFFKPIDGFKVNKLKLKVLPKQILRERVRMTCSIRYEAGLKPPEFLERFQKCYPNLNIPEWYVIRSIVEDYNLNMTIIMDKVSADYIEECGFILHWVDPNCEEWYSDEYE